MANDAETILRILKAELRFLDAGGYRTLTTAWMPPRIFEDSPTCLSQRPLWPRCQDCTLMQFAPIRQRRAPSPCRFIPLDEQGSTLTDLYQHSSLGFIEASIRKWLTSTISVLERS